jgi:predicted nucleic acid-binding protein
VRNTLVDSGPLIALFDRDDSHHRRVLAFLRQERLQLVTTWPVLTEVTALLPGPAALDFVDYVCRGGIAVENLGPDELAVIASLGRKYADVPMDFADASLVALAMRDQLDSILSLDRDFEIYRLAHKRSFRNLLSPSRR